MQVQNLNAPWLSRLDTLSFPDTCPISRRGVDFQTLPPSTLAQRQGPGFALWTLHSALRAPKNQALGSAGWLTDGRGSNLVRVFLGGWASTKKLPLEFTPWEACKPFISFQKVIRFQKGQPQASKTDNFLKSAFPGALEKHLSMDCWLAGPRRTRCPAGSASECTEPEFSCCGESEANPWDHICISACSSVRGKRSSVQSPES